MSIKEDSDISLVEETQSDWEKGSLTDTVVENDNLLLAEQSIGESIVTSQDSNWGTKSFSNTYSNPIALATVNDSDGDDTKSAQLRNITSDDLEVRVGEFEDGNGIDSHGTRTIGVIVFDLDKLDEVEHIKGDKLELSDYYSSSKSIDFDSSFDNTPIVIASIQNNTDDEVIVNVKNISTSGFDIFFESVDPNDSDGVKDYGPFDVAWIAIDPDKCDIGVTYDSGIETTDDASKNDVSFDSSFSDAPAVIATVTTTNGSQRPCVAQVGDINSEGTSIGFVEHQHGDSTDTHDNEDTNWLAIEQGSIIIGKISPGSRTSPQLDLSSIMKIKDTLIEWDSITHDGPLWKEDFESGDISNWTVNDSDFEIKTDKVYEGSYSAGIESGSSTSVTDVAEIEPFNGDEKEISTFEYYFYETSGSTGGGIRLYDGSDNFVCGFATDNPEWDLDDGDGRNEIYGGDGYDRWVYVKFENFDWDSGTYDYYIEDLDNGHIETGTRSLENSTGVSTLKISNYNGGWGSGDDMNMWFDNIIFDDAPGPTSITIETRHSLDNGDTWSSWKTATNGDPIPELTENTDVSEGILECRQILETDDSNNSPELQNLGIYLVKKLLGKSFFMFGF